MNNEFCGILHLDHPSLSDDDHRQIQLGQMIELPDGTTVAEYVAQVEELKKSRLKAEAEKRDSDLAALAGKTQTQEQEKEKDEDEQSSEEDESEQEDGEVRDEDLHFGPEVRD